MCVHVCVGMHGLLPLVKGMSVKAADLATSSSRHQPKKSHGQSRGSTFLPSFSPASSPLRLHPQSTHSLMPCVLPECRHAFSPLSDFHLLQPSLPPISRPFMLQLSCSLSISLLLLFNNSDCVHPAVPCVRWASHQRPGAGTRERQHR